MVMRLSATALTLSSLQGYKCHPVVITRRSKADAHFQIGNSANSHCCAAFRAGIVNRMPVFCHLAQATVLSAENVNAKSCSRRKFFPHRTDRFKEGGKQRSYNHLSGNFTGIKPSFTLISCPSKRDVLITCNCFSQ